MPLAISLCHTAGGRVIDPLALGPTASHAVLVEVVLVLADLVATLAGMPCLGPKQPEP